MALVESLSIGKGKLYVWKVIETIDELREGIILSSNSLQRLTLMKSMEHKKAFLAVRNILLAIGISDKDLIYDEFGKPFLSDGTYISISHSFNYAVVYLSKSNVGVDIEKQQEKIIRLASKFCNENESNSKPDSIQKQIRYFTQIWSAKEAVYKMCNSRSLSFAKQVFVNNCEQTILVDDEPNLFYFETIFIEDFLIVCAFVN